MAETLLWSVLDDRHERRIYRNSVGRSAILLKLTVPLAVTVGICHDDWDAEDFHDNRHQEADDAAENADYERPKRDIVTAYRRHIDTVKMDFIGKSAHQAIGVARTISVS
ncbi:MAG: hypothetical protein O3A00_14170 [Planctomycetota bacterium]|nr:hypothetical protein [Planctomycetota bacterium]